MTSVASLGDCLTTSLNDHGSILRIAGAVAGVALGSEQVFGSYGLANLNTNQPFTPDTGFLLGSVTKVMVATVLMRAVEAGAVDLDAPVKRYVPEFTLKDPDAAELITVRMLINHTSGIDADTLWPTAVRGRDASRSYTALLPQMGVVFEPGCGIHYSNPGFVLAGRIIEEWTGLPFERAMDRELLSPAGMRDATFVQTQAFLRRTAIGAFADTGGPELRATSLFTYPESMAGAGSTSIVSVADMLEFGRVHLNHGVAADGTRVLAADLVQAMVTPEYDLGIPQAPPVGLGWWLFPIAGTTAPRHTGASPGGTASFCILPEYDATIITFATGPDSTELHDHVQLALIEEITGQPIEAPLKTVRTTAPDTTIAGEYASFQTRTSIDVKGDDVFVTKAFEAYDDEHSQVRMDTCDITDITGTTAYKCVAPGQYAPATEDLDSMRGFHGRLSLVASLPAAPGRRPGIHSMLRFTPKLDITP